MHGAKVKIMSIHELISRLTDAIAFGVYMKKDELSNEMIISMLDDMKVNFLREAGEDSGLRTEVLRMVAGHKFKLLSAREAAFDDVEKLYREVLALGFPHLMEEGTVGIFYAQYCMRLERHQLARVVLEEMLCKAKDASLGPLRVRKELAADAKRLLNELATRA